ncbi:hypothetical protein PMAYCL1PPCAC_25123, partial [Pristionchus mayeri]
PAACVPQRRSEQRPFTRCTIRLRSLRDEAPGCSYWPLGRAREGKKRDDQKESLDAYVDADYHRSVSEEPTWEREEGRGKGDEEDDSDEQYEDLDSYIEFYPGSAFDEGDRSKSAHGEGAKDAAKEQKCKPFGPYSSRVGDYRSIVDEDVLSHGGRGVGSGRGRSLKRSALYLDNPWVADAPLLWAVREGRRGLEQSQGARSFPWRSSSLVGNVDDGSQHDDSSKLDRSDATLEVSIREDADERQQPPQRRLFASGTLYDPVFGPAASMRTDDRDDADRTRSFLNKSLPPLGLGNLKDNGDHSKYDSPSQLDRSKASLSATFLVRADGAGRRLSLAPPSSTTSSRTLVAHDDEDARFRNVVDSFESKMRELGEVHEMFMEAAEEEKDVVEYKIPSRREDNREDADGARHRGICNCEDKVGVRSGSDDLTEAELEALLEECFPHPPGLHLAPRVVPGGGVRELPTTAAAGGGDARADNREVADAARAASIEPSATSVTFSLGNHDVTGVHSRYGRRPTTPATGIAVIPPRSAEREGGNGVPQTPSSTTSDAPSRYGLRPPTPATVRRVGTPTLAEVRARLAASRANRELIGGSLREIPAATGGVTRADIRKVADGTRAVSSVRTASSVNRMLPTDANTTGDRDIQRVLNLLNKSHQPRAAASSPDLTDTLLDETVRERK